MTDMMKVNKVWFLGSGILLIILGAIAISVPLIASLAIETLFGWILLLGGLIKIVHSFRALSAGKCLLRLVGGIIYCAVGGIFLVYPLQGVLTLTLLLAILFIIEGIIKVSVSLQIRPALNWGWMLISGIAAFILATLIFSGYPSDATWVIGLLVGINLIFSGWTMLMLSTSGITVSTE